MAKYRTNTLDLSTRIEVVAEMLLPVEKREWGQITKLAEKCGVSRTRLYQLKDQAHHVLQTLLAPQEPGPKGDKGQLTIDEAMIKRAISIFPLIKGSTRDIQMGLEMLFGVQKSVGYIHQTLQEAGERARQYNEQMVTDKPILAEVDEIFQGRKTCLTVVDGDSFLLLNLAKADARDETNWGVTLLDLEQQGYQFADVVADGARGIAAGVKATEWGLAVKPDLFHLMCDAHTISQRLEKSAYRAIEGADKACLVAQQAEQLVPSRGRPLKADLPLVDALQVEEEKMTQFDNWHWLLREVRSALDPITSQGHLRRVRQAQETIETALELMTELARTDIDQFRQKLTQKLDALLAPLAQLETQLAPVLSTLTAKQEALIIWACQYRQQFQIDWSHLLPVSLQTIAEQFEHAFSLFHRASSLVESIHSWIRPYLHIHRGLPDWLAQLLQLWWNHHRFQRGKRAGHTPAELAGIPNPPSLKQLFANLFEEDLYMR